MTIATDHRQILHGFFMPEAGSLTVLVTMTFLRSLHQIALIDEFGISHSDVIQLNETTLVTTGANGQASQQVKAVISLQHSHRNHTYQKISHVQDEGAQITIAHVSPQSFAAGEFLRVDIGCLSTNQVFTNDMEVSSRMNFRYRIDQFLVAVLH